MDRPTLSVLLAGALSGSLVTFALLRRQSSPRTHSFRLASAPICAEDDWFAIAQSELRKRSRRPSQSNFRVTAVVLFWHHNELFYVVGHNDESCCLTNSCCAERAAFLQLGNLNATYDSSSAVATCVQAVYIVSDAPGPITPGVLCREFMLSSPFTCHDTKVAMEGAVGPSSRMSCALGDFFPYASPYTKLDSTGQVECGKRLSSNRDQSRISVEMPAQHEENVALLSDQLLERVRLLAKEATQGDHRDDLHPISFGAACIFADGSSASAHQKKALEYGCSLDAICQLAPLIDRQKETSPPMLLCMADQFGVCHAPFSTGRSYLVEHGWGECFVLVQNDAGLFSIPKAADLVPGVPEWGRPV
mmetsp:Transcript_84894/g.164637  ORF Transcript_84894/g.164637 Transcript_84894/m.164637 type:complete len:362 (+) Transcript_84894:56-1141(+)